MKHLWIAVFVLLGTPLFAQDAKVVELSPSDALEAKAAYEDMKAAEKKWGDLQAKLQRTYKDFDSGLEFSADFKFIVPKQSQRFCNNFCGSCLTTVPAINTYPYNFCSGTACGGFTIQ
jgi:hypothetical protein